MAKLADLLEKRSKIVERMNTAHEADDNDTFNTAETELRTLDAQIDRQKKVDAADRSEPGTPINGDTKLDAEIRSKFGLGRAIAGACGLAVDWGFEREVQPELAKRAGKAPQGIYIPTELFEVRAANSNSNPAGGYLIGTDHRPELYVSALVAASVTRMMGATVLNGLTGNLEIPTEASAPAIGWVADNQTLGSDDAEFGSIGLSPKHAGALSEWSRNMILQASPDVEQLMRSMLARDLALAIDLAAINGGGTGEPDGVLQTDGIQTQAYATSLFHTAAEMIAKADIANVATAKRSFLSTNTVKKIAMKALDGNKLPIGVGKIFHDEATTFSNQVPATLGGGGNEHGLIYADWSELLIGIWSEIDILANPFETAAYNKGNVKIRAMATMDCNLRHPAAFVSGTGVTAAAEGMA